ncbi:hypothetical protein ACSAZL_03265 [Methanosarcina sp. T3]|uniref:hypothetical protein n=1 Tax=Methanosarcina sp. T3 TaxID=3439062 RepID=UPI003F85B4FA
MRKLPPDKQIWRIPVLNRYVKDFRGRRTEELQLERHNPSLPIWKTYIRKLKGFNSTGWGMPVTFSSHDVLYLTKRNE